MKKRIKADNNDAFNIAKKAVEKKFGDVVKPMKECPFIINTISTRSLSLDFALGRGGFALGRIYEIFGEPSSGKSTLAISTIAEAQSRGMNAVYVDAEHSADRNLFENMGVDTEKLTTVRLFTGEDNMAALEMLIKSGTVDIAVVDSVASLIPKAAAESDLDDNSVALLARLMSKTMLRIVPIAAETRTCILFINQTRNKIVAFGDPTTTPGGDALSFYSTGRVKVKGIGSKSNRIKDDEGNVIGHKTIFEIVKNKLGVPFREAIVNLIYGVGYDTKYEVFTLGIDLGVILKSGSWFSYVDDNGVTTKIGHGKNEVMKMFKDNEVLYNSIRNKLIDILDLKKYYNFQKEYDSLNE